MTSNYIISKVKTLVIHISCVIYRVVHQDISAQNTPKMIYREEINKMGTGICRFFHWENGEWNLNIVGWDFANQSAE